MAVKTEGKVHGVDPEILARVVESILTKGDLSQLDSRQRAAFYIGMCDRLGLDPLTKPFDMMVFQGKTVLYANKGCADQLANKYDISREILDCKVVTVGKQEFVFVKVRATMPVRGGGVRSHEDVAMGPNGDGNAWMKVVTKANRRSVFGLVGLGMIDRSEIEATASYMGGGEPSAVALTSAQALAQLAGGDDGANPAPGSLLDRAARATHQVERTPDLAADLAAEFGAALDAPEVLLSTDAVDVFVLKEGLLVEADATHPGLLTSAKKLLVAKLMSFGLHATEAEAAAWAKAQIVASRPLHRKAAPGAAPTNGVPATAG